MSLNATLETTYPGTPSGALPARTRHEGACCPHCGNVNLLRIHRHALDRVRSLVQPVYRLSCDTPRCGWEGTLAQKHFARHTWRHY